MKILVIPGFKGVDWHVSVVGATGFVGQGFSSIGRTLLECYDLYFIAQIWASFEPRDDGRHHLPFRGRWGWCLQIADVPASAENRPQDSAYDPDAYQ